MGREAPGARDLPGGYRTVCQLQRRNYKTWQFDGPANFVRVHFDSPSDADLVAMTIAATEKRSTAPD
jgi:hypothetical protein